MEEDLTKDEQLMLLALIDATAFGGKDVEMVSEIKRKLRLGLEVITNETN